MKREKQAQIKIHGIYRFLGPCVPSVCYRSESFYSKFATMAISREKNGRRGLEKGGFQAAIHHASPNPVISK